MSRGGVAFVRTPCPARVRGTRAGYTSTQNLKTEPSRAGRGAGVRTHKKEGMSLATEIVIAPDERLRTECARVEKIDDEVIKTAKRMAKAMYKNEGCGIAAPQIGVLRQIVVIDVDWADDDATRNPMFLINPVIVEQSDQTALGYEGCLSVPGVSLEIARSTSVTVQALDLEGRLMQYEAANNLLCVCLQHEIDHLHGITMLERLDPAKRLEAMREYQEALAAGARPGETGSR